MKKIVREYPVWLKEVDEQNRRISIMACRSAKFIDVDLFDGEIIFSAICDFDDDSDSVEYDFIVLETDDPIETDIKAENKVGKFKLNGKLYFVFNITTIKGIKVF